MFLNYLAILPQTTVEFGRGAQPVHFTLQHLLGQPQTVPLEPETAVLPAPVVDGLGSARLQHAAEGSRHLRVAELPDVGEEAGLGEGEAERRACVLRGGGGVGQVLGESGLSLGVGGLVADALQDLEDVLQHGLLSHVLSCHHAAALEGGTQPHLYMALVVNSNLILVNPKEADHISELRETLQRSVVEVQNIGVGQIGDVGKPEAETLNEDVF